MSQSFPTQTKKPSLSLVWSSFPLLFSPLMSSSSLMTSHGVALATAVAVSGTVILIALCRQKPFSVPAAAALDRSPAPPWCHRRSCMSSSERKRERRASRKKKRVHFAAEVVEFDVGSCNEEAEEGLLAQPGGESCPEEEEEEERRRARGMPANRVALYNGILRDRGMHRLACCY